MKITEVRVKIMDVRGDKLQAFCTVTLDDSFVIRDLKIIGGSRGIFVAMPSRKLTDRCPRCGCKNHLRAAFCNDCGSRQTADRAIRDEHGRTKLHADVAHPINSATRELLQGAVVEAFRAELERSKQPGYVPPKLFDDFDDDSGAYDDHDHATPVPGRSASGSGRPGSGRFPAPSGPSPKLGASREGSARTSSLGAAGEGLTERRGLAVETPPQALSRRPASPGDDFGSGR